MMTLEQFIKKYDGKPIDTDGAYGPQCMDLMNQYTVDVLGLPLNTLAASTAYISFLNGHPDFEKIYNEYGQKPQPGDIIYWNTKVGPSGHVAVYVDGWGDKEFTSFDQNWPTGSISHLQKHDYYGVAGWLRYKNTPMTTEEKEIVKKLQEAVEKLNNEVFGKLKKTKNNMKKVRLYSVIKDSKLAKKLKIKKPKKK